MSDKEGDSSKVESIEIYKVKECALEYQRATTTTTYLPEYGE